MKGACHIFACLCASARSEYGKKALGEAKRYEIVGTYVHRNATEDQSGDSASHQIIAHSNKVAWPASKPIVFA